MKEATGDLNLTLVTIVVIGLFLVGVIVILPRVFDSSQNVWGDSSKDTEVNFGRK
jgi:hypothetical protein